MQTGMKKDFSWGASAREYVKLYNELAGRQGLGSPGERPKESPKQAAQKKSIE
jgi:hypothetical protein